MSLKVKLTALIALLVLVVVLAASALYVYIFVQETLHEVEKRGDYLLEATGRLVMAVEKAQEKTLDPIVGEHDASAGWALGSAVLVAVAGVWAWRRKGLGREVTVPLLVLTALSTAILGRTALLGGRIRHPEARASFVAPATHGEEHEHH